MRIRVFVFMRTFSAFPYIASVKNHIHVNGHDDSL
jgi:hypothetical protein